MTRDKIDNTKQKQSVGLSEIYSDVSWFAARNDNDAPLKLTPKELNAIGKMMNKRVKRGRKASV